MSLWTFWDLIGHCHVEIGLGPIKVPIKSNFYATSTNHSRQIVLFLVWGRPMYVCEYGGVHILLAIQWCRQVQIMLTKKKLTCDGSSDFIQRCLPSAV